MPEAIKSESSLARRARPINRNISIFQIVSYRLPLAGFVSILHRISGLLLVLLLPFILYLFEKSLVSEISFATFRETLAQSWVKLVVLIVAWAYLHHFCAGIRHLLMDIHWGLEKKSACCSAQAVFFVSLPLAALVGAKLFGVF